MLTITIPEIEIYNDKLNLFTKFKEHTLQLEHSLIAISKWESKWNKPFLSKTEKTLEESLYYIYCMVINNNVDYTYISTALPSELIDEIQEYIKSPMTATTINSKNKQSNEIITSEVIYYWMVAHTIPFECQKWHLNRLLMLISVCNEKNAPKKKMSKKEIAARNRSLNSQRRAQYNTKG